MVKTLKMVTMDNPQPSPKVNLFTMDAVHRLNVGGVLLLLLLLLKKVS
jgi:hypothetical protein